MTGKAHPDDVLIVGSLIERREHPQFTDRQVVSVERADRLRGRDVRRVYWTIAALIHQRSGFAHDIVDAISTAGNFDIDQWQPDDHVSLVDRIAALKSFCPGVTNPHMDSFDGYRQAIDDVLGLIVQDVVDALTD